ncbi:endonuclease VIII [Paenibacillus sp. CC-CFT747]|nr:endonuclease VIII [Paenibacillus sp. CC-CFT747]
MPELPEMETYRRLLSSRIIDRPLTDVEVGREKSINVPVPVFRETLIGNSITGIERRAKHLLFHLASGEKMLLHLMLGGWMFYGRPEDKPDRTVQVEVSFGEERLFFIGLRLGYLHLHKVEEAESLLDKLGPEPLSPDFTAERLTGLLSRKKGILKTTLVDQSFLSGIGNCYSDEICFEAGLLPSRTLPTLTGPETRRLSISMQAVLKEAVAHGGYMEDPLYKGDRLTGGYNDRCRVYDRKGEPCLRCGRPVIQVELASRKCFYCENCQH